jgi:histidyl-tRNA synthetase
MVFIKPIRVAPRIFSAPGEFAGGFFYYNCYTKELAMSITAPKGTKDILPQESAVWIRLENIIRQICSYYLYEEIRTPIFEKTELFVRGVGDDTDIVQKEMYTFTHRDKESFSLKPEGTAGVVRAYIENKLYNLTQPVKMYYLTPCFRAERPQKGRYRQFHQFGIEAMGTKSASIDAEVMALADSLFKTLKINDIKLYINSVGCGECRKVYYDKLKDFIASKLDSLCPDCKNRYEKNPMRALDCKNEACNAALAGAPYMIDYLCGECGEHFSQVQTHLKSMGIKYEIDPKIVRGLDYYEKTAFEFVSQGIGAQSAICGGGRYDGLSEIIGGPQTAGIGFGLGLERLLLLAYDNLTEKDKGTDIYIASVGDEANIKASELVKKLRDKKIKAEKDYLDRSLKAQMKYADKLNANYVLILGDEEMKCGRAEMKNMITGSQVSVDINNFVKIFIDCLGAKCDE